MATPPLALESLSIRDFRGIEHLELDFRGPDGLANQLVVLAGPNGSGKTAVLEAGLIVAGGEKLAVGSKGRRAIRKGANDFAISARFRSQDESREVWVNSGRRPPEVPIPHWYFSSWRAPRMVGPIGVRVRKAGRRPVKNDKNRLFNIKEQLANAAAVGRFQGSQGALWTQYQHWIRAINQAWEGFYPESPGEFSVDYVESDEEAGIAFDLFYSRPGSERLEVDYLSAGQLELFLFLAALALNDRRKGIVFIDEPELHLDPQWHRPIMRSMIQLQPNAQFIVATHSPGIYDAARSYERHFLVPENDPRARYWSQAGVEA